MIIEWIAAILLIFGALFMLIAGIGVVKLNDFYSRMHAATKAPSLGVFLMVLALIVNYFDFWLAIKGILIIIFIFMTTPIGSHMLSKVAHLMEDEQQQSTGVDELTMEEQLPEPPKKKE